MKVHDYRQAIGEESDEYDARKDVHSTEYEGDSMYVIGYLVLSIAFIIVMGIAYLFWR